MLHDEAPTPHQLADSPELAILDAVSRTLLVTRHALFAAHPVLECEEPPEAGSPLRRVGVAECRRSRRC